MSGTDAVREGVGSHPEKAGDSAWTEHVITKVNGESITLDDGMGFWTAAVMANAPPPI